MNLVMSVNQDYGEGAGKLHISRRTDHHFESHQYGNRHISGWNLFCCKVSLGDVCVGPCLLDLWCGEFKVFISAWRNVQKNAHRLCYTLCVSKMRGR